MNIKEIDKLIQAIVESRSYMRMIHGDEYPEPGSFVTTGPQVGNVGPALVWLPYLGRVVQVRKKAGAFGSNLVFLRHLDDSLSTHENQSFFRVDSFWLDKLKELYADLTVEDYSQPYTIAGKYPETGKVIEVKESDRPLDESPSLRIDVKSKGSAKSYIV